MKIKGALYFEMEGVYNNNVLKKVKIDPMWFG
jgi:hypothetical protein